MLENIGTDQSKQKYIFCDFGHDSLKVGIYSKSILQPYEYFMLPTQLYP